ncbi:MAG: class I SAM-dependent methyltransferase [Pseudonocardiaceae bacterium]
MNQHAQWDIVTGVGITALGVAAGRAIETHRPDALVNDPYAESFVHAARSPVPMPTRPYANEDPAIPWASMATYMGVRSRFFDEYFTSASAAGIDQVVLLAAGLDARAFRLDWRAGTTVYELDAPKVLRFKDDVLTEQGAQPRCHRCTVAVDLRKDWPAALRQAGFHPGRPTAWLAEGLLPFLPDDAKDHLFAQVNELSAAGSQIAVEHIDGDVATLLREPMFQNMARRFGFDMAELWPGDQHCDPAAWLAGHGWMVCTARATDVARRYRRPLDEMIRQPMRSSLLITARAEGQRAQQAEGQQAAGR